MRKREKNLKSKLKEDNSMKDKDFWKVSIKNNLMETNLFRITTQDFDTKLELIKTLHKLENYEACYQLIQETKKIAETLQVSPLPVIYFKYEGLSLEKLGREQEALHSFKLYREALLSDSQTIDGNSLLLELTHSSSTEEVENRIEKLSASATVFSEISSIYLREKNYKLSKFSFKISQ